MNEEILISVIVPAYNVESYIARCLNSILNQTHRNLEVLVIDDGSTDHTGIIIDEYAKKDDRIIAIHQKNQGLVEVRENGIEQAKGKYITFVDGDDSIEQDMYARLLANMIKYAAEISHCGIAFVYSDHKDFHYNSGTVKVQDNLTGQIDLLNGDLIEPTLCSKLYLRELLINSCLDKSIVNNEDLLRNYIAFYRSKKSVFEDFCGYQYLQREGSMSKNPKKTWEIMKHISRARKTIVDHCREVNNDTVLPFAIRSWLNCYVNVANQYALNFQNIDYVQYEEIRSFLKSQKKNIKYLIKRQQLVAWLIILSPKMHRIIYTIYSKRG